MPAPGPDAPLSEQVALAFSSQGALARSDPNLAQREVQQRLAAHVAQAIETRGALVAEAGTGVGKTFAYLVPLLLSGRRALVSTATKSLQDQLFLRDLPRLCDALGLPVTLALLKGRSSYLCLQRLQMARQGDRAARPLGAAHAGAGRGLGAGHAQRRPGRDRRAGRALAGDPAGQLDARQLPGQRMPAVQGLPRDAGAARGHGCRRGGGQPPPVLRRHGAARQRRGRAAAHGGRGGVRRGAPAGRGRRAVPGHEPGHGAADRLRARPAGHRAAAGARPARLACAGRRAGTGGAAAAAAVRRAAARAARRDQAALGRARAFARLGARPAGGGRCGAGGGRIDDRAAGHRRRTSTSWSSARSPSRSWPRCSCSPPVPTRCAGSTCRRSRRGWWNRRWTSARC